MVLGEGVFQAKGTAQPSTGAESAQFGQNLAGVVRGPESAARGAPGGRRAGGAPRYRQGRGSPGWRGRPRSAGDLGAR